MSIQLPTREHISHPLTLYVLSQLNLPPDFDYPLIYNSRIFVSKFQDPPSPFSASEISAVGLIGKVFLKIIESYLQDYPHPPLYYLDEILVSRLSLSGSDEIITSFLDYYPTSSVYRDQSPTADYLLAPSKNSSKRHSLYKSILLTFLADANPAIRGSDGIFTSPEFRAAPLYKPFLSVFEDFFSNQPEHTVGGASLLDLLRAPSTAHPNSIHDQLDYIRQNWSTLLGEDLLNDLLRALDRINEELKPSWEGPDKSGSQFSFILSSCKTDSDTIHFSKDLDWMPNVILLAKNTFVWMDQLSKKYHREIHRLDQIPDQELNVLSDWGITGLWLIGIWQRSTASQKIKQMCGNPDAVPSAYSIFDYTIADTLGGEAAFNNLSSRAQSFNIRLAADMVPNHMGISSKWVIEHPERFLSLDQPPFPSYSFGGPDLSNDTQVGIFLEDHYFDKTDASIVFKRVDNLNDSTMYIYHGNDGTSLPWNDTAQLDFLQQEVREAVIQTILHVARNFPIIRFDAAMTLAKKHFQRLWFPEPGTGGAIPTRTDFGMTKSQFDQIMTDEFWREVVDRVANEAPDTLLLAEAFWMMEGYFVRTLGMHRVYNSAFMHMLRNEDNAGYRDLIKKTLEFDPEILKRYVNFMNNPDEDTAISQFGSDGKYFGVCIMMATLPGLPMFGHGQIEGFSEKYGMEYQRAYYNEQPNQNLIDRHRREVFPLLHKRYLFAEAENFVMYDFVLDNGTVNQDVFAHSNQAHGESALILYHNKWASTHGVISRSTEINGESRSLSDSLGLLSSDSSFVLFREHISGLEYIRSAADFRKNGLRIDLGAYQYQVFLDFKEVTDPDGDFSLLNSSLQGNGSPNLQEKLLESRLSPLFNALDELVSICISEYLPSISSSITQNEELSERDPLDFGDRFSQILSSFASVLARLHPETCDFPTDYQELVSSKLAALNNCYKFKVIENNVGNQVLRTLLFWVIFSELTEIIPRSLLLDIFRLSSIQPYTNLNFVPSEHTAFMSNAKILTSLSSHLSSIALSPSDLSSIWFSNQDIRTFLEIHEHDGITWFNQESFEFLLDLTLGIFYINSQLKSCQSAHNKQSLALEILELKKFMYLSLKLSACNLDLFNIEISKYPGSALE